MTNDKSLSITYVSTSCTITVPDLVTGLQDTEDTMTKGWVMCLGFFNIKWQKGNFSSFVCVSYTDKKENLIFLIYEEIQSGAVAKSYIRKGFLIYEEMRKYFPMYEEAASHIWLCNCSILNFLINEENFFFFFISLWAEKEVAVGFECNCTCATVAICPTLTFDSLWSRGFTHYSVCCSHSGMHRYLSSYTVLVVYKYNVQCNVAPSHIPVL